MILQLSFIMEKSIDILRQALAYSPDFRQVVYARALNLLHSTEMTQKLAPPRCTNSRQIFQGRGFAFFVAPLFMAGDGKTMRLIADMLDKVQRGRVASQYNFCAGVGVVKCFKARFARGAF